MWLASYNLALEKTVYNKSDLKDQGACGSRFSATPTDTSAIFADMAHAIQIKWGHDLRHKKGRQLRPVGAFSAKLAAIASHVRRHFL
jgi:hypothetical protein